MQGVDRAITRGRLLPVMMSVRASRGGFMGPVFLFSSRVRICEVAGWSRWLELGNAACSLLRELAWSWSNVHCPAAAVGKGGDLPLLQDASLWHSIGGRFRMQYQDRDIGDALVNLTSTADLEDLTTIKVIPIPDDGVQEYIFTVCEEAASAQSDDTDILSTPSSSVSTRTRIWLK